MADEASGIDSINVDTTIAENPAATLRYLRDLLSAKDDTSRFVGLALLKSVLDNQPYLREDISQLTQLWESIPPKFLDRLLRAGQNQKVTPEEAQNMIDIAVAVLHVFTSFLPAELRGSMRLLGRLPTLINALINSSHKTTTLVLQTLLTLVSEPEGCQAFMSIDDLSPLTEIAPQQAMVLDILDLVWSSAATESSNTKNVCDHVNQTIPLLISSFYGTDAVTLVAFIGNTVPKLPFEALPKSPDWLQPLVDILKRLVSSRPTKVGRSAYANMAASLMRAYPLECPQLLFNDRNTPANDVKPFSYLFVNLILIDLRSSFPSLLSNLNNSDYSATSRRLSSDLDIVLFFIGFLIQSLDDETDPKPFSLSISPDLILKLRKSIAETMSLTIEYIRDRWDASVAGAAGLHVSARQGNAATSEGSRLTLTWDSINEDISSDNLILAIVRTLAVYLREDENESLRRETVGLMDMLIELYQRSTSDSLNFKTAVLRLLEVVLTIQEGSDAFLAQYGWELLSEDLLSIVGIISSAEGLSDETPIERAEDIVRVLLIVVENDSSTEPREDWMKIVKIAACMKPSTSQHLLIMDLQVAILTLAGALLISSSMGMQKRYSTYTVAMMYIATQLQKEIQKLDQQDREEISQELSDFILTLENLR